MRHAPFCEVVSSEEWSLDVNLKPVVSFFLSALVRIALFAAGLALVSLIVYGIGIVLVPVTDPWDKAILAAINPDQHVPVLDQFMRATTDYSNFLIAAPILSWFAAYLLYQLFYLLLHRRFPGLKVVFAGLLAVEGVVLAVFAAMGKIMPNKTYTLSNVMFVVMLLVVFFLAARFFHAMDRRAINHLTLVFLMVFASGILCGTFATGKIKSAVARPRPLNDAHKPWNEGVRIIPDEVLRGNNSFPSGHTSGTFSLLTPIFWYTRDRRVKGGLAGWAVLQGLTRVYTAAHFPFCCLMGGVLGFATGTLIFFIFNGPKLRHPVEPAKAAAV